MTLNETWKNQLKMSGWIAKERAAGSEKSVIVLKEEWFKENMPNVSLAYNCFFCNYADMELKGCGYCPGRLVDADFDCDSEEYHYSDELIKFYEELVRLNKIRISRDNKDGSTGTDSH